MSCTVVVRDFLELFEADGAYTALLDDTTISAEWVDLPPTDVEAIQQAQRHFADWKGRR